MHKHSMVSGKDIENSERIYRDRNLQIVFGITLTAAIGIFSLSPAFPRMIRELHIPSGDIGLLITVFTFPGILLMPVMGILADRLGRKKVLVPSLVLFAIAGGACLFAYDFRTLLLLRFFQGVGVAPLSSLNVALIGDLYSEKRRTAAMGYNQSVFSVGAAGFSAVGGGLAILGWYYPFALPLLAIPVALLVICSLEIPAPKRKDSVVFAQYLRLVSETVKKRDIIAIYAATVVVFVIVAGPYSTYFPILMGTRLNVSPLIIGLVMSTTYIASALSSSQMGKIAKGIREKTILCIGFFLYAAALLITPALSKAWVFLVPAFLLGTGQGITLPSIQSLLGGSSSNENRAAVMSLYGTALRLGQTLGPLLTAVVLEYCGLSAVFYVSACLALAACGLMVKKTAGA